MNGLNKEQFARAFEEASRQERRWQNKTAEVIFLWKAWSVLGLDSVLEKVQTSFFDKGGIGPEILLLKFKKPTTAADFWVVARNQDSPWLLSAIKGEDIFPVGEGALLPQLLDRAQSLESGEPRWASVARQVFTPALSVSPGSPFIFGTEVQNVSLLTVHLYQSGLFFDGIRLVGFEEAMTSGRRNLEGRVFSFLSRRLLGI